MALYFSHLSIKRMIRLPFFPSFFVNKKKVSFETLKRVLSYDKRRFKISEEEDCCKVSAATFSDLNELANILFNETGFRALVVSPERQLLFEKDWGYFDRFTFFSEDNFTKCPDFSVPKANLGFFSDSFHETILQLLNLDLELAEKTMGSIVLSNVLCLPVQDLPASSFMQQESFFEKVFWRTGLGIQRNSSNHSLTKPTKVRSPKGLAEIDFSLLWPTLLTKPLYNLGPDSLDCGCCTPANVSEKNVLPNSIAVVEILQDGFFFESGLPSFSSFFHERMSGKQSRLNRQEEFCLKTIPLGPFFREKQVELPLVDAVKLQQEGKAKILSLKKMHWFCLLDESVVSKAISFLNKSISLFENKLDQMRANAVKQHGVLSTCMLSKKPEHILYKARLGIFSSFLRAMPAHLCSEKSAFFNSLLGLGIEGLEANVLDNFAKFAVESKSRVVSVVEGKAIVRSDSPYSLIKQFSEKQRVPALLKAKTR